MRYFGRWLLVSARTVAGTAAWPAGIVEQLADTVAHLAGIAGDTVDTAEGIVVGTVVDIADIVLYPDYVYPLYSPNRLLSGYLVIHRLRPCLILLAQSLLLPTESPLVYMRFHPIPILR